MTDPGKTGTAGSFGNDPASDAFIAECAEDDDLSETHEKIRAGTAQFVAWELAEIRARPQREPQTFDLTYRFTGTTKHDPRLMLEKSFRDSLPRGVTFEEVTDA